MGMAQGVIVKFGEIHFMMNHAAYMLHRAQRDILAKFPDVHKMNFVSPLRRAVLFISASAVALRRKELTFFPAVPFQP